MGSNQKPFYRVVVSDSRRTPTGNFIETIGTYEPGKDPVHFSVDVARADEWIKKGARPSETVKSLIEKARAAAG
jgi:small subunit ribosomal protein S16